MLNRPTFISSLKVSSNWNQRSSHLYHLKVRENQLKNFLQEGETDLLTGYKRIISECLELILQVPKDTIFTSLNKPNRLDDGDLLLPLPKLGIDPSNLLDLKQQCYDYLSNSNMFEKVIIKGSFIQFFIDHSILLNKSLKCILSQGSNYGKSTKGNLRKAIIEYSSPNIAKPFHVGHLRSTIIGEFLANIYENFGWEVVRMNYLGDWGKQFGILAIGYKLYGDPQKLESDPISHLFDVYVQTNKLIEEEIQTSPDGVSATRQEAQTFFKRMEDGEEKALRLWKQLRGLSIQKYIKTYSRLGIIFDIYSGESQITKKTILKILRKMERLNLTKEKNGAVSIDLTKFNPKLPSIVVKKSDNTSLYITRDVGACIERQNHYHFDKMIYVIASQQDLYMKQLFEIIRQLGYSWVDKLEHVNFGMVKGMSTRKGNVVFLDEMIRKTTNHMLNVMHEKKQLDIDVSQREELAEQLGLSAIIIQDMRSKRINNYKFEWDRMLSFEGHTGPYLQYAHSRLCAIENKAIHLTKKNAHINANLDLLEKPEAILLARILCQYPYILRKAFEEKEPCTLVTYLFKLSHQVSICYKSLWVVGQPKDVAGANLVLYLSSKYVLSNGLKILGINPVKRM